MFGNPKGEVIHCDNCKRFHDIRRGTVAFCACGKIIKSKEYNFTTLINYINLLKSEEEGNMEECDLCGYPIEGIVARTTNNEKYHPSCFQNKKGGELGKVKNQKI